MFTIFRNALARYRGQILGWGLSLAALCLIMTSFYDTIASQKDQYMKILENYPKEMLAFFGTSDFMDMFTPAGYLNMEYFSYMTIIIGIFAILAGSGMLAGDEESGTLDLVLGHPVSRTALFVGRLLAFLVATIGILVLNWIGFLIGIPGSGLGLNALEIGRPFISLFAVLMIFGTLALVLSMLLPSRRMAAMTSGILMVASFFITALAQMDKTPGKGSENLTLELLPGRDGDQRGEMGLGGRAAGDQRPVCAHCLVALRAPRHPRGRRRRLAVAGDSAAAQEAGGSRE